MLNLRFSANRFLNIRVGKDEQKFMVHECLLCPRSKFFQNAVKTEWALDDQIIKLPEDKPSVFEAYLTVLYTSKVPVIGATKDENQYPRLIDLYILADKLIDIRTKNVVVQAMMSRKKEDHLKPSATSVAKLYGGTPVSSPARRLFVDIYADSFRHQDVREDWEDLPAEFLQDSMCEFITRRDDKGKVPKPWQRPEHYMEKEEEEAKNDTK